MVGVYRQAGRPYRPAPWEFVELVTHEGLVGTGEWSVVLEGNTATALERLASDPGKNLLDDDLELPLFMAWWDLVGQVLGKPLHRVWGELFDVGFEPPSSVPLAAYSWQRFADAQGKDAVTFENWPEFAAQQCREGYRTLKLSMSSYEPYDFIDLIGQIRGEIPSDVDIVSIHMAHGTSLRLVESFLSSIHLTFPTLSSPSTRCFRSASSTRVEACSPTSDRISEGILFPKARAIAAAHDHTVLLSLVDAAACPAYFRAFAG